jgi:signal transduction histidine kinase
MRSNRNSKFLILVISIALLLSLPANVEIFRSSRDWLMNLLTAAALTLFAVCVLGLLYYLLRGSREEGSELERAHARNEELQKLLLEKDTELTSLKVKLEKDIGEYKSAGEQSLKIREQLRSLTARLESIREEERTRISREVHDELGQQLTVLKMNISWINKKLDRQPEISAKLSSMLQIVDETIHTVRKISTELRPGILDDLGLAAAIEWQCREFEKKTGITCAFHNKTGDFEFNSEISTAVFRIVQEALTNVLRHSEATRVDITMFIRGDELMVDIKDNGKGISVNELNNTHSLGLLGIKERAHLLGGDCSIVGMDGKGTEVMLHIPLAA